MPLPVVDRAADGAPTDSPAGGPVAGRPRGRPRWLPWGLVALAVLLVAAAALSLMVGSRTIPVATVLDALARPDPSSFDVTVVREGRVPRTLLGVLVGAALGLAGTVMQGLTRNPLADPGLLGVNAGAAFALVVGLSVLGVTGTAGSTWCAMGGALLASVAVYLIGARGRRGVSPASLALGGAAVSALLVGLTSMLLLHDVNAFNEYRRWTVGSLAGRGMDVVVAVAPVLLVGIVAALLLGRTLDSLGLGDDLARGLGVRVGRAKLACGAVIVVLCGGATAAAGPLAFVGLAVPHMARLLTGPRSSWILAYSLLLAPTLMLLADTLGRVVARPGELQVGVVTALLGAPLFIALVRRRRAVQL